MAILPLSDQEYLRQKGIAHEELEDGGRKAVVLKSYPLPPGRYDTETTDVLLLLPSGYPDASPDMFYTHPWVKLMPENKHPNAADVQFVFKGATWQRWSRHLQHWRPGLDGLRTMILRVQQALEVAK